MIKTNNQLLRKGIKLKDIYDKISELEYENECISNEIQEYIKQNPEKKESIEALNINSQYILSNTCSHMDYKNKKDIVFLDELLEVAKKGLTDRVAYNHVVKMIGAWNDELKNKYKERN